MRCRRDPRGPINFGPDGLPRKCHSDLKFLGT
jgi:hypothetical protein